MLDKRTYVYLDSEAEAQKVFVERFDEVMLVAARNVQLEVTLPWYMQMARFYGEQYSTSAGKVKPQHLAPGDSMVFQQELSACGSQAVEFGDSVSWKASWLEPGTFAPRNVTGSATLTELTSTSLAALRRGRAIISYAETLKKLPELGTSARQSRISQTLQAIDEAQADAPASALDEIAQLLVEYRQLVAP